MRISVPDGWNFLTGSVNDLPIKINKLYQDGTDVIIEIRKQINYEVWSSAEHRASGPNENKESEHENIDSALDSAVTEMKNWDDYITKLS
ncbi:hypothetical protein R50072_28270 [Simiduia litorea]|uniref:hypothetical protein n=1 Tax=Simiduia litorea TaxID=1435348 RepID=UPI0036F30A8C